MDTLDIQNTNPINPKISKHKKLKQMIIKDKQHVAPGQEKLIFS